MEIKGNAGVATLGGKSTGEEVDQERRGFVKQATIGALALGLCGAAVKFLRPNVLYEPSKSFKVGTVSTFAIGSRTVIEGRGIEIVRERDGIHAISLVCTHLGCLIRPVENDPDVGYACPCHGSTFALQGDVLGGPAPTALPWYDIYQDHTGALVVDTSKVNDKRTKLVV